MTEFFHIPAELLKEAEQAGQFRLVVPDNAKPDRNGTGFRWTECCDITSLDSVADEKDEDKRVYFEISVRFNPEGSHAGNIGKPVTRRFYINEGVTSGKYTDPNHGQVKMTERSLRVLVSFCKALGIMHNPSGWSVEWQKEVFGVGSSLVGQKVWVAIYQHPNFKDDSRNEIEFERFLPY